MKTPRQFMLLFLAAGTLMVFAVLDLRAGTTPKLENGISVGKPKVFDNRTLTLMLENLSQTLQAIQTQFIDPKALATALASVQGYQSTEVTRAGTLSTIGTPATTTTDATTTGHATDSGTPLPNTHDITSTTTTSAVSPTPPTLDTIPAFSGYTPTYGESPSDLLSDQVNLSYQMFNLRMILERSLSDRLMNDKARMQAVLGFNVTVDPPATAVDAVAVVEITLEALTNECKPTPAGDLSLVAVMPQEKTYNSAALSSKSNAFGGSAVVKMIQLGYSQRTRGQTFYLYRDNDTVSYERMTTEPNKIVFGWMFRPVLGRRSVSPGWRQLFAVVSLPGQDVAGPPKFVLKPTVRTYWKKYNPSTLTSYDAANAGRLRRFGYALSLGAARPEIFHKRYENSLEDEPIAVDPTATYECALTPEIHTVSWTPVGAKGVLVSVVGANFFSGTQVTIGDKTYSGNGDGLALKSNDAFDLLTTADAIASGTGVVSGRYGPAIPFVVSDMRSRANRCSVVDTSGERRNRGDGGAISRLDIVEARFGAAISGARSVTLRVRRTGPTGPQPLHLSDLVIAGNGAPSSPIVTINGNTMPLPYLVQDYTCGDAESNCLRTDQATEVLIEGSVPDSYLPAGRGDVRVVWPFRDSQWLGVAHVNDDPAAIFQVIRTSDRGIILLSRSPLGFTKKLIRNPPYADTVASLSPGQCWNLFAAGGPIPLTTSTCKGDSQVIPAGDAALAINLATSFPDKVVLMSPSGVAVPLDVPKAAGADAAASKVISVKQYDAVWIDVPVDDANAAVAVQANGAPVTFNAKSPGADGLPVKTLQVLVTREVSAHPGSVDLTVLDKSGKLLSTTRLTITPCVNCRLETAR